MIGPDDPRHGTPNGYANCGCRCDDCSQAMTDYRRERRQYRSRLRPGDPRHGTMNGYTNHDCRCSRCSAAFGLYMAGRRAAARS